MSKVEMHAPFKHYRGTIGDLVYKKYRGKTVVALKPEGKRRVSEAQSEHQQTFSQAATWAKAAVKDQELYPIYKALGDQREISAYAAAMADALKPPAIKGLDLTEYSGQAGDPIYFLATDNGEVRKALVAISDADGRTLEEGSAVEIDGDTGYRMYTTNSAIPVDTTVVVTVKVIDRPGNITELSESKTLFGAGGPA
jgi:hypothetical protein